MHDALRVSHPRPSLRLGVALNGAANAADPRYPDWPCAQAKVPELSVAAVWDGPSIDTVGKSWKKRSEDHGPRRPAGGPAHADRGRRRQAAVDFIDASGADKAEKAKLLFAGLFEALNQQRVEVMDGIERLAQKEKELADKIRSDRVALGEFAGPSRPGSAQAR